VRESLIHRRAALESQRIAAERRLDEAVTERRTQLLESDLDNGQPVKNIVGRLRDERDAIADALASIDLKLSQVEERFRQDQDRSAREKEAELRRTQVAEARKVVAEVAAGLERLVAAMQTLSGVSPSAGAAAANAKLLGDQLSFGCASGCAETENYVIRMLAGNAAIVGQALPVVAASKPAPKIVDRLGIMVLQHSKWSEDGEVKTCAKDGLCKPPRAIAEKAISLNLAVAENSSRYLKLREIDTGEGFGQQWAHIPASDCLDLQTLVSFCVPKLTQRRYAGRVGDSMCEHDDLIVSRVLSSISRSSDDERRMFAQIQDEAQNFVNTYWGEILLVARALFKRGRLDKYQIADILRMLPTKIALNQPGADYASDLIAAGKVNWGPFAWDDDTDAAELYHLGTDDSDTEPKLYYPHGKGGEIYIAALVQAQKEGGAVGDYATKLLADIAAQKKQSFQPKRAHPIEEGLRWRTDGFLKPFV
jgi:hypothetical protein